MNLLSQFKSFRLLTYYSVLVFLLAVSISYFIFQDQLVVSSYTTFIFSILSLLLIWRFGIRFPYIGLVSMERLVQIHLLLTVPLFDAVLINMCAGFIMPFTDKKYRLDSYKVAVLRGLSNAAMNIFMILSAGILLNYYLELPLTTIDLKSLLVIVLIAIVIQIINIGMIALYHTIDNKDFKKLLNPALVFADLIFIPTGVLSALLYQNSDKTLFWLFVFFIFVVLLSFNSLQSKEQVSKFKFNGTDYKSDFLDINSVCFSVMRRINYLFKYDSVYLGSYNNDLQTIELYIKKVKNNRDIISESSLIEISQNKKLKNQLIQIQSSLTDKKSYAVLSAPFMNQEGLFAFICIVKESSIIYSAADVNLFELMINRYAMGLSYAINYKNLSEYKNTLESVVTKRTNALKIAHDEKSKLVDKLQSLAQRDGLTGLFNRRYLDGLFKKFKIKAPKYLSMAIIDIDYFKDVNDRYGHERGDLVLQKLSKMFNANAVKGMKIARYGGEEFVILLYNIPHQSAIEYFQKLLKKVPRLNWNEIDDNLQITISMGLSHYPETKLDELFTVADKNLYKAKNSGRNQMQPQYPSNDKA